MAYSLQFRQTHQYTLHITAPEEIIDLALILFIAYALMVGAERAYAKDLQYLYDLQELAMSDNIARVLCRQASLLLLGFLVGACLMMALPMASSSSLAAPPITPSGLNTQVNLSTTPPAGKTQYNITGGTRPGGGLNLYHSFGNFNVPTNNIANFLNAGSINPANPTV